SPEPGGGLPPLERAIHPFGAIPERLVHDCLQATRLTGALTNQSRGFASPHHCGFAMYRGRSIPIDPLTVGCWRLDGNHAFVPRAAAIGGSAWTHHDLRPAYRLGRIRSARGEVRNQHAAVSHP